jgi:hypothetical protein
MIKSASIWSFSVDLFAISFALNWIWEILQMFAYQVKPAEMWTHVLLFCTLATVIDGLVTIGSYVLAAKLIRNWAIGGWKSYALMSLFGAVWAVIFELAGKSSGLWSYSQMMPIVPIIKVGLLPLLQLTLLMPAAMAITVWRHKHETNVF